MTTSREFSGVSRRCLAVVVAVALLLLSGCVTSEGGALGELKRATEHAQYAVATVEDSFGQFRRDRTLSTVADTTAQDMLSELEKAQKQVFELKVDTAAEDRQRTAVLKEIAGAARAITGAEDWIDDKSSHSADEVERTLRDSRDRLASRMDSLEPPQ
ncbi:hypothetical protein [Brevibacterium renqingii]|uniref:hypothetical protein n=1 Tax=Brevibacterium renqingii TaxID=2776916 RepID=UPI001AE0171B|nr:hypothetical protein [Brevibacterium renqingii]